MRQGRRAGLALTPPTPGRKETPPTVLEEGRQAAEMLSSALWSLGCWVGGAGRAAGAFLGRAEERGEGEGGEAEEALTTLRQ